ncbi:putative 4'-phosphopantetheinyl transferase [Paratrimastix pyriformis]|uniref:holo-[acyl-carrier-protein] synthase n=1 Tax=Paratrimastix pyriformis TaxID=342808 RepID=A0ABQ8U167_9EUKA|nr:putative 4'-phosphopantetheinyl transferase [Paratrimastix pyriformis]
MQRRWRVAVNTEEWKPTPSEFENAMALETQPEEQKKTRKYYFEADRKTSIVGRLLLRSVVHDCLGIENRDIAFDRTPKGKPILRPSLLQSDACRQNSCGGFNINISHSGHWVVCAAECDAPVGIDVTDYGMRRNSQMDFALVDSDPTLDRTKYRPMAASFLESFVGPHGSIFAPTELAHMQRLLNDPACTAEGQLSAFSRYWTAKEAYVKVFGDGLGFEVSRLCFDFSGVPFASVPLLRPTLTAPVPHSAPMEAMTALRLHVDGILASGWSFESIRLDRNHICTVAVAPHPPPTRPEWWQPDPPNMQFRSVSTLMDSLGGELDWCC